jgi:hypothetical protein
MRGSCSSNHEPKTFYGDWEPCSAAHLSHTSEEEGDRLVDFVRN